MKKIFFLAAMVSVTFLQFSCTKPPPPSPPPRPNKAPVANAGPDQTITLPVNSVTLIGTGTDSDGTIIAYKWIKITGPAAFISTPNQMQTTVASLVPGIYELQLTVTDNLGATGSDMVVVTVKPSISNAGPDQTITFPENSVTLDGSGSQSDGIITSYLWTKIYGPAAIITTPDQVQTNVTNLVEGNYEFELSVTDNLGATGTDRVRITVMAPLYNDWFTIDPINNYVEYDSSSFETVFQIFPGIDFGYSDQAGLIFTKNSSAGNIEYKRILETTMISIQHPSQSNPFEFEFSWYIMNEDHPLSMSLSLFSVNPYNNSISGREAFMQAVELILNYQYRCIIIPKTLYNSLNIDWNNYLEVVAALGITP